jgi:APA family basic amino acid/polyamine antiporter
VNTSLETEAANAGAPRRQLSLFDSTSIIVGIIIGSGLYETTPQIARCVPNSAWLFAVWITGGIFALLGALCYAELASAYPDEGGDYVYQTRSFGRPAGFLFAWIQLWVVRPGSIGAMSFVFARYATRLYSLGEHSFLLYAFGGVVLLSSINIIGLREGKWTQNILTIAKVLGILAIFVVGFTCQSPNVAGPSVAAPNVTAPAVATAVAPADFGLLRLAMILVLFSYAGWNEMAYVAAEVRDPQKNILRALLLGTGAVMAIYVAANAAFLHALGFEALASSQAVAADVARLAGGQRGATLVSVLVCISALGAMNGMTFTGARIYYAMGREHALFAPLGHWNSKRGTPTWSLVIEGVITLTMVVVLGLQGNAAGQPQAFERMVIFTAPLFWLFLSLTGVALMVLRRREPNRPRSFRVPLYPVVPLAFLAGCLFMVYSSFDYAYRNQSWEALWAVALLAIGVLLCCFDRPVSTAAESQ